MFLDGPFRSQSAKAVRRISTLNHFDLMRGFNSLLDMIEYFATLDRECIDKHLDEKSFSKVVSYA